MMERTTVDDEQRALLEKLIRIDPTRALVESYLTDEAYLTQLALCPPRPLDKLGFKTIRDWALERLDKYGPALFLWRYGFPESQHMRATAPGVVVLPGAEEAK